MAHKNYSWVQISDLHVFKSTDLKIMLKAYENLAKVVRPDFLIVTGDYRHKRKNISYQEAMFFLNNVVDIFGLKKKDVFLVPGNHDVDDFEFREEIITTVRSKIESNADAYSEYMKNDHKDLRQAFNKYFNFVKEFYQNEVDDVRTSSPSDVFCVSWKNRLNIVVLNTALLSEGNSSENNIIDLETFAEIKVDNSLPTIVLAHHDIESLVDSHKGRVIKILNNIDAKAYLCGDEHKINRRSIENEMIPNTTIPRIVCGKSAIETGDSFSDLCVIHYMCESNEKVSVQVYRYDGMNFVESNDFYHSVNQKYSFPLKKDFAVTEENDKNEKKRKKNSSKTDKLCPISIWLPDAELAKGTQTRFNTFTQTSALNKYFDNEDSCLGVVSVKGIGKTFVLQVKRMKSSRKYYCLPKCHKPSVKNNWATERVSFDTYSLLQTENIYDDLVLLWKFSIKCYVINHFRNTENNKTLKEYIDSNKINEEIEILCNSEHCESLEMILQNLVSLKNWNNIIKSSILGINNLCNIVLKRRRKNNSAAKDIAIFIDKVDQAIKQTKAEPPGDCVLCKKKNNYTECKSTHKSSLYCSEESGCQSKNCCYGCEIFASSNSSIGLRIYEESNAAKTIHVNIWQYLQLALMDAAGQLFDESRGQINVFYTIRQEAFNCEGNRLGEQNQKIGGKVVSLNYTIKEQNAIFLDCIRRQEDCYLFAPNLKNIEGSEEFAFVGVKKLCHPYCLNTDGSHQSESVFSSIYRHSFDRSRDIQRYGEILTKSMDEIRECVSETAREELVKEKIEELAASLAYCSKQSESTVNPSYYTEKMRFLPNYWADNENFENLLSMIDRNLLFEDELKGICRKINGCVECPKNGCRDNECKRHPFSVLYNMGYLGYITPNPNNNSSETQQFLDASEISYFVETDSLMSAEHVAYIIHPALTKTIEKKYNRDFMHFSGFILGKGLKVETSIVSRLVRDRRELDYATFVSKYYYTKKGD